MTATQTKPLDGSAEVLRQALPLMSRHAAGYAPDSYALWYEYVRGDNRTLREEVDTLVKRLDRLSLELTYELHQKHVADRSADAVQKARTGLIDLMNNVQSSVEAATSDATDFDAQLAAFGEGLSSAATPEDLQQHVSTIRDDVDRMNRSLTQLNSQLDASRGEVAKLTAELNRAREEASIDPLSGIVNRRGFDTELRRLCRESKTQESTFCLLMLDIDHFKKINDTYGHPFGDQVIRGVAQAMSALSKRQDIAARYGGEEFALLLPGTPLAGAKEVAERIRRAIERALIRRGQDEAPIGNITISIGVSQCQIGEAPESVVARADRALYASKHGGRNRVTCDG